ncbi:hypothetical protein [Sphingobium abikonense]|uniref:hypothetical protein n=1 Tax=Sphingobium abikonense TaxID=86193 RepID=UPI003513001E
MARLSDHHQPKCGVEGKCSVPMWSGYGPDGFCDKPAWGEQYSEREPSRGQSGRHAPHHWPQRDRNGFYPSHLVHLRPPMADGYCCANHGGPREDQIRFVKDGNMWCAFMPDFINLAESVAGFGETQDLAEADLAKAIGEQS